MIIITISKAEMYLLQNMSFVKEIGSSSNSAKFEADFLRSPLWSCSGLIISKFFLIDLA